MEKKKPCTKLQRLPISEAADWPALCYKAWGVERRTVGAETGQTGRGGYAGLCTTGT